LIVKDVDINLVLKQYFGYDSFKSGQKETIESILSGTDTLVIMPTGGGKSLCYQLPALVTEGTVVVVSPLIALMKDQVDSLRKIHIPATFINSTLSISDINTRVQETIDGKYKLVYIAPERLESSRFIESLRAVNISFLAVDEAHCISEWGHDFRPSYLSIIRTIEQIVRPPVIALTATATPEVQEDIVYTLKMKNPGKFIKGFDRPNLNYITEETGEKTERIAKIIKKAKDGSNLIYCGSRKRVEQFSKDLNEAGIPAQPYHAGYQDNYRKYVQESFFNDKYKVIVATNAFGMGIDKPDVRNVIHVDFTQTLEGYYQEAGRGGRDGAPADCHLLYRYSDKNLMEFFINSSNPAKDDIKAVYDAIYDVHSTQLGNKPIQPILIDEPEIGNKAYVSQYTASSVITLLEKNNILLRGSTHGLSSIKFTTSKERIAEYLNNSTGIKKQTLEALLRSTGSDAFSGLVEIDINHIAGKYMLKYDDLLSAIQTFEYARMLKFIPPGTPRGIIIKLERMPINRLPIDFEKIELRRDRAFKKLDIVIRYAQTKDCKRNYILDYFQEIDMQGVCGRCSSCMAPHGALKKVSGFISEDLKKVTLTIGELNKRFGKIMIADILKGKLNDKVKTYNLQKTRAFGVLSGRKQTEIRQLVDEAIEEALIAPSPGIYPTLYLTQKGIELVKGEVKEFAFIRNSNTSDSTDELYKALAAVREEIAELNAIVPRAVASDKTLRLIASKAPKSLKELESLDGIGYLFVSRFGNQFVNKVNEHIAKEEPHIVPTISENARKISDLVQKGKTLSGAISSLKMNLADASKYIQEAIESGITFRRELLVDETTYKAVCEYIRKHPNAILKDIREHLAFNIEYPLLRIAVALVRREK